MNDNKLIGRKKIIWKIIFKSYLRRLLQDLKDLKEMIKQEDYKKADNMIDNLINDTQSGIEDN